MYYTLLCHSYLLMLPHPCAACGRKRRSRRLKHGYGGFQVCDWPVQPTTRPPFSSRQFKKPMEPFLGRKMTSHHFVRIPPPLRQFLNVI